MLQRLRACDAIVFQVLMQNTSAEEFLETISSFKEEYILFPFILQPYKYIPYKVHISIPIHSITWRHLCAQ